MKLAFLILLASVVAVSLLSTTVNTEQTYKFCGQKLQDMQKKVCAFAHEPNPCFKSGYTADSTAKELGKKCCKGCTMSDISAMCCRADACLQSCYPGKGYKIGQVY